MNRGLIYTRRNILETIRDPLSFVFCAGVPAVLMIVMYFAFYSPETAFWFSPDLLGPGIMVFSYTFVMLYTALLVSKDRATSFLSRLFTSPMTTFDFVFGYTLSGLLVALCQALLCLVVTLLLSIHAGTGVNIGGSLLSVVSTIPCMIVGISIGIILGSLFTEKSAPGAASVFITVAGFIGGAWTPIDPATTYGLICRIFPYYPSVSLARASFALDASRAPGGILLNLATALGWALLLYVFAVLSFRMKMNRNNT